MKCTLCPRNCGVDRENFKGFCGEGETIRIAKYQLHYFEEPVISGERGSGAIFFTGCPLRCVYCQNTSVSRGQKGYPVDKGRLADIILSLCESGAENINLVTPTHFSSAIAEVLKSVKPRLSIPVIYNCGGYESVETLKTLDGLIDVYLPDFKYYSSELSTRYSSAPDYFEKALFAIAEMCRQQPKVIIKDGLIKQGVIIRHLVLPGCADDSLKIIETIAEKFPSAYVSIMRQYTPDFYDGNDKNLKRKLTSYEYNKVIEKAESLGLKGFMQHKGCETTSFTPDF